MCHLDLDIRQVGYGKRFFQREDELVSFVRYVVDHTDEEVLQCPYVSKMLETYGMKYGHEIGGIGLLQHLSVHTMRSVIKEGLRTIFAIRGSFYTGGELRLLDGRRKAATLYALNLPVPVLFPCPDVVRPQERKIRLEDVKKFGGALFQLAIRGGETADPDLIASRFEKCKNCHWFDPNNNRCLDCGCKTDNHISNSLLGNLTNKLAHIDQECPNGYW